MKHGGLRKRRELTRNECETSNTRERFASFYLNQKILRKRCEMNDADWFAEHAAYLATPEWAFRRGQVLARDNYQCQARLDGCQRGAVQVHHLSYKHWRNEPLFELTSVCVRCHEQITEMDRDNRPPERRVRPGIGRLDVDGMSALDRLLQRPPLSAVEPSNADFSDLNV